jgi:23S rRNA pseudouridine1911/1915/1917 synthase
MSLLPPTFELTVDRSLRGMRIDTFLGRHFRNYTTWRLARLVRAGAVTINWTTVPPDRRVFDGERVTVRLLEPPDKLLQPEAIDLPIVFEDAWLLVADKPAGIIAHPTGEFQTGSLVNALQRHLDRRSGCRGLLRPGMVHRLDRQTSGLTVVALQHNAHVGLAASFERGRVSKSYLALVEGTLAADKGSIDLPIGRANFGRGVLMSARADALDRRPACTRYEVVARYPRHTLVEARPLTGRNHQIRVHFAHIGHPLAGDEFYLTRGAIRSERSVIRARRSGLEMSDPLDGPPPGEDEYAGDGRHALHASRLEFAHPITDVWMRFDSALPADIRSMIVAAESGELRLATQST